MTINQHDANKIIQNIIDRLLILADNPAYSYSNTPKEVQIKFEAKKRTFKGYSESEISKFELEQDLKFPKVYRAFLKRMGRQHNDLFMGSDVVNLENFLGYRKYSKELLAESGVNFKLEKKHFVYLMHQGYVFYYFVADGGFDSPVYGYMEGENSIKKIADGFTYILEESISDLENLNKTQIDSGGYWLTIPKDGNGQGMHFPAKASAIRPLDIGEIKPKEKLSHLQKSIQFLKLFIINLTSEFYKEQK